MEKYIEKKKKNKEKGEAYSYAGDFLERTSKRGGSVIGQDFALNDRDDSEIEEESDEDP